MGTFVKEIEEELIQKLIPFWENLRDERIRLVFMATWVMTLRCKRIMKRDVS